MKMPRILCSALLIQLVLLPDFLYHVRLLSGQDYHHHSWSLRRGSG